MRPWKPLRPTSLDAGLPSPVRRARRPVRTAAVLVVATVVAASQFPSGDPQVVGVHGRVGDATVATTVIPAGARTLDPTQARPGLLVTTTTTRPVVEEDGPLVIVNGREVIYLKRTPLVMQLLWVASHGQ